MIIMTTHMPTSIIIAKCMIMFTVSEHNFYAYMYINGINDLYAYLDSSCNQANLSVVLQIPTFT